MIFEEKPPRSTKQVIHNQQAADLFKFVLELIILIPILPFLFLFFRKNCGRIDWPSLDQTT